MRGSSPACDHSEGRAQPARRLSAVREPHEALLDAEVALPRELRDRVRADEVVVARPQIILTRADLGRDDFATSDTLERSHLGEITRIAEASHRVYLRAGQ